MRAYATSVVLVAGAVAALAQTNRLPRLELGRPITKEIHAGEVHRYEVEAPTGALVRGSVRQDGISVNVRGFFPDGSKIRSFAGPPTGTKSFRFVVEAPGAYQLELTGLAQGESQGEYAISIGQIQPISERLAIKIPEAHQSPRIQALARQITAGDRDALRLFWDSVEREGTPLFENPATEPETTLVTFLWRAKFETYNVLVLWNPYATERPEDFRMTRLGDTDLWYKTVLFPKGSRFLYQLSPNDTLTRSPNAQRYATAQSDPLNPKRRPADPNVTKYEVLSVAELPGASPQPWSDRRPGTDSGQLHQHRIRSELLGNERAVTVYTPPGYRKQGADYPLLLLFDGDTYKTDVPAPVILDNLIADKKIPAMVAVLVNYPTQNSRSTELFGNHDFAEFISKELLPWTAKEYHVTTAAARNVIGGMSAGGFAAAFIALHHPDSFGNVLSQSGAFWWSPKHDQGEERNSLAREYASMPRRNLRFFLEAGLFENDIRGVGGQILEHNRHLRDVLRAKGYEVHYQEFPGGHDRLSWRGSLADGLIRLVGIR